MATTDSRPGFRLPWTSDARPETDDTTDAQAGAETHDTAVPEVTGDSEIEIEEKAGPGQVNAAAAGADQPTTNVASEETIAEASQPEPTAPSVDPASGSAVLPGAGTKTSPKATSHRPTKFLADLTRAMQAAAESARATTIAQLQADAKAFVEDVHARSSTEAAELRKRADDDVASIRDWSKVEIARIREETETRIGHRKGQLEEELEQHAARIEREIERVHGKVAAFEAEMDRFFEALVHEEDPTRIAVLAQNLPEPPPFDEDDAPADAPAGDGSAETVSAPPVDEIGAGWATNDTTGFAAITETASESSATAATAPDGIADSASETRESADDLADPTARTKSAEWPAADLRANAPREGAHAASGVKRDPRLAALGLSADFDAAEAEAAAAASVTGAESEEIGEDLPELAKTDISARLAGLVADRAVAQQTEPAQVAAGTTRVSVAGLVSVSAIASFKRHLARLDGVQAVTVSSSPDGEFVFAVTHRANVSLRDAIPTLPGFGARVGRADNGVIQVTARDPESES